MSRRFHLHGQDLVQDTSTGLVWPRSANPLGYPLSWADALAEVADMNRVRFLGCDGWRMPNRVELRSLVDHARRQPALPAGHPFREVFLGWYWTSTTNAGQPAYAWNVHLEGGRMFYSRKDEFRLLWPVRGESSVLPRTGQNTCFDAAGVEIPCAGDGGGSGHDGALACGQDGAQRRGLPWPEPRFEETASGVLDRLTGLEWASPHRLPSGLHDWAQALRLAADWNEGGTGWRLPEIAELESLLDADRANPALPPGLPNTQSVTVDGFWSATVSGFDAAWAFVLYVQKGAVGVGFKAGKEFAVWPVRRG
ncbi:Lcl C-terminal domain-containing protein [Humidesulfovibrio sp.]